MTTIAKNIRYPHLSCIDIYGNQLLVSRGKKGNINFTLYHNEVTEGPARKDFEDMSLRITSESGHIFQMVQGLYEMKGESFIISEDPIRDGRNFLFIEQENEESYYMTIGRDLANDLNRPNQTNIELSGETYDSLYSEATKETGMQLIKRKELS